MDFIEVEIVNWGKHQRKDVKKPSWFALDNRILEDSKLFDLSDAEWKALIYIFSQASQQGSEKVKLNVTHAKRVCGIQEKILESTISRLSDVGVTRTLRERNVDVTLQDKTGQDTTRQDIAPAHAGATVEEIQPVKFYCDEYKARYNHSPVIGPKQAGILTRFAKSHPRKWPELIRGYLQLPDMFLVQRSHPTELLESKLNEIERFLKTGKIVTRKVATDLEKKIDKAQGTSTRRKLADIVPEDEPLKLTGGES